MCPTKLKINFLVQSFYFFYTIVFCETVKSRLTMFKGFSVEEPLDLELGIILGLDCALEVERLSLAQAELGVERYCPDGLREGSVRHRRLALQLAGHCVLYLLHLV